VPVENRGVLRHETHTIDILYNDIPVAAQELEFHVDIPQQSILVATAGSSIKGLNIIHG
jgi:hypothetical protein